MATSYRRNGKQPARREQIEQAEASGDLETYDPETVSAAQAAMDAVNLDELVAPVVHVAIMEHVPRTVTLPDGSEGTRYTLTKRIAELTLFPNVDTQLKAIAFSQQRRELDQAAQVEQMLKLLLEVWRESEPDMTLERLRGGLDVWRISKLFQMLFTPPSRQ
jgi:hypothetical protein